MAPPLSRKSESASSASPAWHPNLRIAEQLPDTKVVRTAFFINGIAALIVVVVALFVGREEWTLHGVRKEIFEWQRTIDVDKKESQDFVTLYGQFKAEQAKTSEVTDFVASKPALSEIILRLGAITPKKIAFDALDFKDTGVTIKATVKGAPEPGAGIASAYEKQLRSDKVLGPMFSDVNLLGMVKNPVTNRLTIQIFCAYKKGLKRTS
jgi:hypothetical protein